MEEQTLDHRSPLEEKKPYGVALKWGIIGGLALCIYSVIAFMFDLREAGWAGTLISVVLMIAFIVLAVKEHRDKELEGMVPFGRAFGTSMLTVLYMALIGAVFTFIYVKFIDPGMVDEIVRQARDGMIEGGSSEEEIEMGMKWVEMFTTPPMMAVWGFAANMFFGLIVGLIVSAIMRRG
jgi:hypothetical protein